MYNYIYLFLIGGIIGSYFSSIIYSPELELNPITTRRSKCTKCKTNLKFWMLIPVFSYFLLNGKCNYCKKNISFKYPLLEIVTGSALVLLSMNYTYDINQFFTLSIMSLLIASSFSDHENLEIPDVLIYATITFSVIYLLVNFNLNNLYGLIAGKLFFDIQSLLSNKKWVGDADSYIGASIGAILGLKIGLFTILLSYWVATLFIIPKLITKSVSLKTRLAFIPFLTLSFFLVNFFYEIIYINI